MHRRALLSFPLALLRDSSLATASDLPVTYAVQDKPLKAAADGTPSTFALYSDAGSTTQVLTTNVNIENIGVVSRVKGSQISVRAIASIGLRPCPKRAIASFCFSSSA